MPKKRKIKGLRRQPWGYNRVWIELRSMPPLTHWRDRSLLWTPEQSDVCGFISALVAKHRVKLLHSQSAMYHKASGNDVILFDQETLLWRGSDYRPEEL